MVPTLLDGDWVLVRRGEPTVGDVVVVRHPSGPSGHWIKRLVGFSGGDLVLHGDAPHASTDSRQCGPVPREALLGRVTSRIRP